MTHHPAIHRFYLPNFSVCFHVALSITNLHQNFPFSREHRKILNSYYTKFKSPQFSSYSINLTISVWTFLSLNVIKTLNYAEHLKHRICGSLIIIKDIFSNEHSMKMRLNSTTTTTTRK